MHLICNINLLAFSECYDVFQVSGPVDTSCKRYVLRTISPNRRTEMARSLLAAGSVVGWSVAVSAKRPSISHAPVSVYAHRVRYDECNYVCTTGSRWAILFLNCRQDRPQ